MKRADLDTLTVLRSVAEHFPCAFEHLAERFPPKIVLAAFEREVKAKRLNYGVCITRPWLEPEGRRALSEAPR